MTYTEAKDLLENNKHLEKKKDKGKTRTLLIVPIAEKGMSETIKAYLSTYISLEAIYVNYKDFDVIVFYDLDTYHLTGILFFDDLLNVLKKK